jgi:hypothetical protein
MPFPRTERLLVQMLVSIRARRRAARRNKRGFLRRQCARRLFHLLPIAEQTMNNVILARPYCE